MLANKQTVALTHHRIMPTFERKLPSPVTNGILSVKSRFTEIMMIRTNTDRINVPPRCQMGFISMFCFGFSLVI
jgi:hypothetical protein